MNRSLSVLVLVASGPHLWLFSGCAHTDLERNAPGRTDVMRPPKNIETREVEEPRDPGEHVLSLSAGAYGGIGWTSGSFDMAIGPEVGLEYGELPCSHHEGPFPHLLLRQSYGLRMGFAGYEWTRHGTAPVFGELALGLQPAVRFSAGWSAALDTLEHGPQGTIAIGPLYLRVRHLFDGRTSVQGGLVLMANHSWVWSR